MAGSARCFAVPLAVIGVVFRRTPGKVACRAVQLVAVQMTQLMRVAWAGRQVGHGYELVDSQPNAPSAQS
jgi:hypothetical protein